MRIEYRKTIKTTPAALLFSLDVIFSPAAPSPGASVGVYICVCVCMYVCMYWVYVCMYVCMYEYMDVFVCPVCLVVTRVYTVPPNSVCDASLIL